jgi:ribosomal protein L32
MGRNRTRNVIRRGNRGEPSQAMRTEKRLDNVQLQVPESCKNCGNPEIDSEDHCDECGFTTPKSILRP